MRVLRFDAGEKWDDPNARWGDPAYVLEPGDPGYVDPNPPNPVIVIPTQPKKYQAMSNNEIPDAERPLLGLAEDCADGCAALGATLPLTLITEPILRAAIRDLKGLPGQTPAATGLIYEWIEADGLLRAKAAERKAKDMESRTFLTDARAALVPILGRDPSPEWTLAGFGNPPGNSNAVPTTQEGRLQNLAMLAIYLTQHPTYAVPAGGPRPEVTAARSQAQHDELSACRTAANMASTAQNTALNAKKAGLVTLRKLLIGLVDELQLKLSADDPRWEEFGLNIPANPRPPEPASELVLSTAGLNRILAEWEPGTRSDDDRILIWIVGTDTDWREYGKSGGDGEETLKNLPSGATVKVKIIALNGSLEAADGPEAQMVVV